MMRLYHATREWVDGRWKAPGLAFKILLLPAIVPALIIGLGGFSDLEILMWAWFVLWNCFVTWRFVVWFRSLLQAKRRSDR